MDKHYDEFLKNVVKADHPAIKAVVEVLSSILKDPGEDKYSGTGDEPKQAQTQTMWKMQQGQQSQVPAQSIMPATALEALLSNFVAEVDYLHNDISTLRSQLQPHLHAQEFDDCAQNCESGTSPGYVECGADMSPTQTKIARVLNEIVRARTRIEHLRSVLVN